MVTAILGTHGTPVHGQLLPGMKTAIYVVVGVSAGAVLLTVTFLYRARRAAVAVSDPVEALEAEASSENWLPETAA